jgi:asparagine synthase (glutamine-hydrolysing)
VVWRQKEQFSDGVGYSWIDGLKAKAEQEVTQHQLDTAKYRFPINTPQTKEEYLYRSIFSELFPKDDAAKCVAFQASVACSTPIVFEWDKSLKEIIDPSGRAVKNVHTQSYQ